MNAENGSAIFGKQGPGQIIIDPSNDKALLFSNNYFPSNRYGEDGLPSSYSTHATEGMMIDLSTPEIRFGNGKFVVDQYGALTSTSGYIANWKIETNKLSSDSGNIYLDSSARGTSIMFNANSKFTVAANGSINATAGEIGDFTIDSCLYNGKSSIDANHSGVYIGRNGISLGTGSTFKVTNDGTLTASSATVTGNITATNLTANVSGTIGGWTINSTGLSGGGVSLLSSGKIELNSGQDGTLLEFYNGTNCYGKIGTQSPEYFLIEASNGRYIYISAGRVDISANGGVHVNNKDVLTAYFG